MACNVINSWTFTALVGAFLDLSIAYLLLCGSTLAYLASKFLGLFGLSLPCPCNGLFGYPDTNNCFQAMLFSDPSLKISSVRSSVKKKFPFDSIWNDNFNNDEEVDNDDEHRDGQSNFDKWRNGNVEMGEEASSSSCNEKKKNFESLEQVTKCKGYGSHKPRVGLRRRKRTASCFRGKVLSFSYDPLASNTTPTGLNSSASVAKLGNDVTEGSMTWVNSEDGRESSKEIGLFKQGSVDDDPFAKNKPMEKDEFECLTPDQDFDSSDKHAIRLLEQALDEEHAACTALYLELEKERSAAATAADEAMAMIMRLQEEKATIEMESRQYQRIIEEKSAYDAEEMNILKEILLRREREKHFLEKEVEAYKQMLFQKEQLDTDIYNMAATQEQRISNEDPVLLFQQMNESVGEKDETKINSYFTHYDITSTELTNSTLAFGKELPIPELHEDFNSLNSRIEKNHAHMSRSENEINQEFKKGMASKNKKLNHQERHLQSNQSTTPQGSGMCEKAIKLPGVEEEELHSETSPYQDLTAKTTESKVIISYNNEKMKKHGEDSRCSDSALDCHFLDVHVINDESLNNEDSENRSEKKSTSATSNFAKNSMSGGLPPIGPSRVKSLPHISRRNSMSAFDYERLKIDNEVGWLRERLKIIQQGREKLNFPAGNREREQVQLQILENIASQLREIRQLTEPGKALRQASLPPPSSKVMSKKRHQRGASLSVFRSI